MKILFLGLGSIGQRHLVNAKKVFKSAKFYALRTKNKNYVIKNMKILKKKKLSKYYSIKILKNSEDALKLKPNLTFICNPSSKHLSDAIRFSKIKSDLFVEKPLGNSITLTKKLIKLIKKNKLITMVGYQTRYHPYVKKIKTLILKKSFGRIIYADFRFMTYLPNHHKYENYKNSYAARKNLGGGVVSSLIHEIDLISYFFDQPYKVNSNKNNSRTIKIEAEDNFTSLMNFKKKKFKFDVFLRLSFSQFKEERSFKILFQKALVELDLIKNEIKIYSNRKKNFIKKSIKIGSNNLFYEELLDLRKCIKSRTNPPTSILNNFNTQKLFSKLSQ